MFLFRKETVSHQSERLTGAITLAQPLSIKLTVFILIAVVIFFLFSTKYSRKETVRGFLMPKKGSVALVMWLNVHDDRRLTGEVP